MTDSLAGSHLISAVLSPAIRLWLRSQVQRAEGLQVGITGSDRQLLSGYIPEVSLAAHQIIYQGLHLSQMRVQGGNIRINLGQVLRGKPLRLLEVVPVAVELLLTEADLNASLCSDLLRAGVADLLTKLFQAQHSLPLPAIPTGSDQVQIHQSQMAIVSGRVTLEASVIIANYAPVTIVLQAGIEMVEGRKLCLVNPCLLDSFQTTQGRAIAELDGFYIDLGPDVNIHTLSLRDHDLICHGCLNVVP
ncbi:MAG: DUF2993 domain-containing protein [Cyanobacteria bacterium]|nr:DUF2993 domain-containing protein [Cyanobacteriota bacterium]MDW8202853.1 DUF2993 domain-containing protein [Cyanobacteriota bacterium SKYGB_h_bin112]